MAHAPEDRLMILHELKNFRVAKGESDIRGWDVVTSDKKKIGKVHELIVDTVDLKVRYLDIDVDSKVLETKTNSHILIPIAGAQLDDDDNRVYLNEISITEITALPPYDHRRITREFETNIASWFQKASSYNADVPAAQYAVAPGVISDPGVTDASESDFYTQKQFSDQQFWGKRRAGRENEQYLTSEDSDSLAPAPQDERPPRSE